MDCELVILVLLLNIKLSCSLNANNIEYISEEDYIENDNNDAIIFKSEKIPIKYWEDNKKIDLKDKVKNNLDDFTSISSNNDDSENFSFYNQLDDDEKQFYDIIYSCSVKSEPDLTIKISVSDIRDIDGFIEELSESSEKFFTALIYDNPQLWWIGNYAASIQSGNRRRQYIIIYDLIPESSTLYGYTSKNIVKLNYQIELVKKDIMENISKLNLTTPYAILKYLHNYFITKIVYTLDESREHIRNIYGAMVENKCVCEGYSEAFQYMAQQYNITCIIARSSIHEWNFVELDNKWYVVDLTYDDPIVAGVSTPSGYNDNLEYAYFLIGTEHNCYGKKYSTDEDHELTYSGYSDSILISYPDIEKDDYSPTELELEEAKLINLTNLTNTDYSSIDDYKHYNENDSYNGIKKETFLSNYKIILTIVVIIQILKIIL